jgi:hypothetical protein
MIRMSLFQRVDRHRKGRAAMLLTIMSTTMLDMDPGSRGTMADMGTATLARPSLPATRRQPS